jgi:mono/diheme cytochrome c family protein
MRNAAWWWTKEAKRLRSRQSGLEGAAPWHARSLLLASGTTLALAVASACESSTDPREREPLDPELVAEGEEIFRFDTFGNETYWTDTLRMHEVVASSVSPALALRVGLKVDLDALPAEVRQGIASGAIDLEDPATTIALLKLNAVLGVHGTVETVDGADRLTRFGITCALCHSTVDDSFGEGIGRRLDGWANRDLNVGAIVALSPAVTPDLKTVLNGWGPGRYDPRVNIDGVNAPLVIPPAYGLRDVELETVTGDGVVSYWNAYVAVTQMHGQGSFSDPRLGISVNRTPDLVTPKLPALREYQLSLEAPAPPAGSFDAAAAERGRAVFNGAGTCAECHDPRSSFTDVNDGVLHAPSETGMDGTYAARTATKRHRTTPLRGAWQHAPYFHDGSAATFADVVDHYDDVLDLGLTAGQKSDLVAYLKSL